MLEMLYIPAGNRQLWQDSKAAGDRQGERDAPVLRHCGV